VSYAPIESISTEHITQDFDCGSDAQTDWLRKHALQAHRTDSSKVRVVTRVGERRVLGYYAIELSKAAVWAGRSSAMRSSASQPLPMRLPLEPL